ncbi:phage tail assembly chaperone [Sandaracinobacteroides sp. A072]|uniref:phage tail assembly chaperone n=1 Tax=Sandaracinobacteroides sp. A072 TaxID=3461146 RepID=UPI0040435276
MRTYAAFARQAAGLATGRLGWRPGDFWQATPAELRIAIEGLLPDAAADGPLGVPELVRLKEKFPDG